MFECLNNIDLSIFGINLNDEKQKKMILCVAVFIFVYITFFSNKNQLSELFGNVSNHNSSVMSRDLSDYLKTLSYI